MKNITIWVLSIFPMLLSAQTPINFQNPPSEPRLFAEGIINTGLKERDFALSPDGSEIFYTLESPLNAFQTILHVRKDKSGHWGKPNVALFAGHYSDLEPAFSGDGQKLYFSSNRPISGDSIKDFDIWSVEKNNGQWGTPKNIGTPVNREGNEFYPSIAKNGNLYFTGEYKNGIGKEDIFMARWQDGQYAEPVPLDTGVNSSTYEFNAFVSPDEDFIIFTSYGRDDDKGRGDLYISQKNEAGDWQPAKNMAMLNSKRLDYCPFVSFDRKLLFFTSDRHALKTGYQDKPATYEELVQAFAGPLNGGGNIYWISFDKVLGSLH